MTLDQFLSDFPGGAKAFAPRIGKTEASLSRIRRGEQNITLETIRLIVRETGGQVSADELIIGHAAPDSLTGTDASARNSGGDTPLELPRLGEARA